METQWEQKQLRDHHRLFAMFPDDFPQAENSEKPKDWIWNSHFFRVSPGIVFKKSQGGVTLKWIFRDISILTPQT